MNILCDTLTEVMQYFKFNDLINLSSTNKFYYDKIFNDPLFIVSIYELSLVDSIETLQYFKKINKKIFVKKLIINYRYSCDIYDGFHDDDENINCERYDYYNECEYCLYKTNFLENILLKCYIFSMKNNDGQIFYLK